MDDLTSELTRDGFVASAYDPISGLFFQHRGLEVGNALAVLLHPRFLFFDEMKCHTVKRIRQSRNFVSAQRPEISTFPNLLSESRGVQEK